MKPLLTALRDLYHVSHAAGVHLCVWTCERDVQRAKARLADALAAQDRLRAEQAISSYTEPSGIPASLLKEQA